MTRTNAHTVLCVLIRAMVAYATVEFLLVLVKQSLLGNLDDWGFPLVAAVSLATLAILVFGWVFPDLIARFGLFRNTHEVFDSDLDANAWQTIALVVLGVIFVADALLEFVDVFFRYQWARSQVAEGALMSMPDLTPQVAGSIACLVLGLALMIGARGLANLLLRLRHGGMRANANEPRDAP